ncbi:MAG: DNA-binding protein [Lachnospiraceae bacterium]|nr:DNA-binding protein [Lachnospiraceae bacterium]
MNRTSENTSRIVISISKTEREKLERLAKQESRSLSNMCSVILRDYLSSCSPAKNQKK